MWQLFCNPFYSTMSAACCDLQARNSFGTYMQPDWAWNTLPWQLMPQSWGMYLPSTMFTPGASIFQQAPQQVFQQGNYGTNMSVFGNSGTRVSDSGLDTSKPTEELALDIAEKNKYDNYYNNLDSLLKSLKDLTGSAALSDEKKAYIEACYKKMNNYKTTKDKYEALKACYDYLMKDNNTNAKIQKYLLSPEAKHKIDGKELGAQLKSIGYGAEVDNNGVAKELNKKIMLTGTQITVDNINNALDGVTAENILEVMSAYGNANRHCLIYDIVNEFNTNIRLKDMNNASEVQKNASSEYKTNVMRKMQTLMKSRAEKVLNDPYINDEEKAQIQNFINAIQDCSNDASKFKSGNMVKLYIVLRQTEARILEDKLKKEYACLGESGLKINLVEKTNEDLKSEGFTIDDTEVEATEEES